MLRPKRYVSKSPARVRKVRSLGGNSRTPLWLRTLRRVLLGIFLVVFDLALIVWISCKVWEIVTRDPYFDIRQVHVLGNKAFSSVELIRRSRLDRARNIFKANIEEARDLLKGESLLRNVEVWRQLPGEIFIHVAEREPVIQVVSFEIGNHAWLIDFDGVVIIEKDEPSNLFPLIQAKFVKEGLHRGSRIINEGLTRALKVYEIFTGSVLKRLIELHTIDLADESDVILKSVSGLTVHLGPSDYENRLSRLLTILEDLKKKKQEPLSIDLRYRYVPVVLKEENNVKSAHSGG